ncbi:MAG: GNAT family N-acetyltransferase [Bacteroidetes bacterium 24-39-8]|nr:MAG: GNAT family N-acetyltransferase [Sphingobacteriia bacterium 35-40-8]OYZ50060.1 MAG: GNAT family N-acetyltransferase [Bacteroidetes bacterium 24-39-8]OZA62296.1 MAG: GNAT family N-acetyltransferase [Sphingobacteriia bacterium 39-39-8]HQR93988.1 GNAT family N-acetyltransferase [Sediminibacterium sp.]HQS55841.1 GNAT family N-acetyltransferase [Sediminibacterium sp.]
MDLTQEFILENNCVLLRPLKTEDCNYLQHFALEEPEIWQYSLMPINSIASLENYIQKALADRDQGHSYPFIVFDKQTGKYAGATRYYDIQPAFKTLQLGYTWYGKAFQGTGLNKHCKYLLLEFAFETLGMERVEFRADNQNAKSIAAMKSIGCTVEGILRSHMPNQTGGRRDSIVLSILKEAWESHVKANLAARLTPPI